MVCQCIVFCMMLRDAVSRMFGARTLVGFMKVWGGGGFGGLIAWVWES